MILVTDRYDTIARVMKRLGAQTVADQIEVVIVAASKRISISTNPSFPNSRRL